MLRSYERWSPPGRHRERAATIAREPHERGHRSAGAFRIVQEAITNTIRHGGGGGVRVSVELAIDRDWLSVLISDDGCGFDPEARTRSDGDAGGMGLLSMRERAELLGGEFRLRAAPGAGASVEARFPLGSPGGK